MTGRTPGAISFASFARQTRRAAGDSVSVAPRAGAEAEVLANRLRLRAGSYWEPRRERGARGRAHVTAGGELRLRVWKDWRLDASVDAARGYTNWGVGVGFWR